MIGGCRTGIGTTNEAILWAYDSGGNPVNKEQAIYNAVACNKLPSSRWVYPPDMEGK